MVDCVFLVVYDRLASIGSREIQKLNLLKTENRVVLKTRYRVKTFVRTMRGTNEQPSKANGPGRPGGKREALELNVLNEWNITYSRLRHVLYVLELHYSSQLVLLRSWFLLAEYLRLPVSVPACGAVNHDLAPIIVYHTIPIRRCSFLQA